MSAGNVVSSSRGLQLTPPECDLENKGGVKTAIEWLNNSVTDLIDTQRGYSAACM